MDLFKYKNYFIQPTQEGIFIFLIPARQTDASGSFLEYDGRDNALFLRTPKETILLDYINPSVHQDLLNSAFVEMTEIDTKTEEIARDYSVPLKKVPTITVV